ncbi:hypothetical protein ACYRFS_05850 [Listeria kieliensis]
MYQCEGNKESLELALYYRVYGFKSLWTIDLKDDAQIENKIYKLRDKIKKIYYFNDDETESILTQKEIDYEAQGDYLSVNFEQAVSRDLIALLFDYSDPMTFASFNRILLTSDAEVTQEENKKFLRKTKDETFLDLCFKGDCLIIGHDQEEFLFFSHKDKEDRKYVEQVFYFFGKR